MSRGTRRILVAAVTAAALCLLCIGTVWAQAARQKVDPATASRPVLAEEFFDNVQSLRGIPVDEFMDTMGMFAAATGMSCADCHIPESGGSWPRYADDNDLKRKSRMMIAMVNSLNQGAFGNRRMVTCYTCHRGDNTPVVVPNLDFQYSPPLPADPVEVTRTYPGAPTADQVLDKYLQAIGGAQRAASITSMVGKGTARGYDDIELSPMDFYAKAPNQFSVIQHHVDYGDVTVTFDGRNAWMAAPDEMRPYPVVAFTGGNLEGAGVDAILMFPGRIKQALASWRVGPESIVNNRDVRILQASTPSGFLVKLYFDMETGLLLRSVRHSDSPVGRVPVRVDYDDYRTVSGVKIPFKWTTTWTNGRNVFQLDSVQVNTTVDAARFTKPSPPVPPRSASR